MRELDADLGSIAILGQYYFNGEGYPDSNLLKAATFLQQNIAANGLAIADESEQPDSYQAPPALRVSDLTNWGRHYVAASVNWSGMFDSDVSISIFGLVNLSDQSGIVTPSVQFPVLDTMSVSISGRLTFGNTGDEYTNPSALIDPEAVPKGGTASISVSVGLSEGSF